MKCVLLMVALGGLVLAGCEPLPQSGAMPPGPPSITIPGQPMADLPSVEAAALRQELREELRDEIHAYRDELAAAYMAIDGVVPSEE